MSVAAKKYSELQDVVIDPDFPELDLALRRGRHVDREDFAWYTLLVEAQDHLEAFYRRYGCELVHKADGYFYLLPTGEKLSRRQLGAGDMLVGQALALLYLDPATIERGGRVTQERVVAQLVVVLGSDALVRAFNPKQKRRVDERVAQKNVRARVGEAIRHLAALGFADLVDEGALKLRPALLRFAEPVRGLSAPAEALAKLVADGEVALVTEAEHEASLAEGAEDETSLAEGAEDETSLAEGTEDEPSLAEGAEDETSLAEGAEDETSLAEGAEDEPSLAEGAEGEPSLAEGAEHEASLTDGATHEGSLAKGTRRTASVATRPRSSSHVAAVAEDGPSPAPIDDEPAEPSDETASAAPAPDAPSPHEAADAAAAADDNDDDDDPPYVFDDNDSDDES